MTKHVLDVELECLSTLQHKLWLLDEDESTSAVDIVLASRACEAQLEIVQTLEQQYLGQVETHDGMLV